LATSHSKPRANAGRKLDGRAPEASYVLDTKTQVWDGGGSAREAPGRALPRTGESGVCAKRRPLKGGIEAPETPTDSGEDPFLSPDTSFVEPLS
jgi:hypothetical protein